MNHGERSPSPSRTAGPVEVATAKNYARLFGLNRIHPQFLGVPSMSILSRDPDLFRKPSKKTGETDPFSWKERMVKRNGKGKLTLGPRAVEHPSLRLLAAPDLHADMRCNQPDSSAST